MRFIKPLDEQLLGEVWQQHRLVLTLEENALSGGFGSAVLEWSHTQSPAGGPQVLCLGIPDSFQDQASRSELMADLGLDPAGIAATAAGAWQRLAGRRQERSAS
jgi:1-deoxy-D-xylulose-5-phosphate synthase